MVDTGASKNFIRPLNDLVKTVPLGKPFSVNTLNGGNLVDRKCTVVIFGYVTTFYLLDTLRNFDGIIGYEFLKEINGKLSMGEDTLTYSKNKNPVLKTNEQINFHAVDKDLVPPQVIEEFNRVIRGNANAFADPNRALPYNTSVEASIQTKTEEPIYSRSYPYPVTMSDFVNGEVEALLRDGIIRKSFSGYNSPVLVVRKKGLDEQGRPNHRLVIDFRKLNEETENDKYPMPEIPVILSNLGKSQFFTTLDLKSGYHQILLAERDRKKTAFSINNGKYEFCRLPFGLKNAPSIFQRTIDDILREYIGKICQVYMDDIIIFSPDEHSHLEHIQIVLKKIGEAGMRISAAKSKFFRTNVEFLGFMVTRNGITTCPDKVRAIREFQKPENLKSLRSFLGLSGFYRRFIKDYATIAKPLTRYLEGENGNVPAKKSRTVKIELNAEAVAAFEKLRKILSSEEVLLSYPDYGKRFELTTDASAVALGAVLSQEGRPITMISRNLSAAEANYATNERELLAIVWALKELRHYLYGVSDIHIFTDHQPLTFSMSDRNPNSKMKRWRAFIEEFSPKFVYKPGKENVVADALSRQLVNHTLEDSDGETVHSEVSLTRVINSVRYPINQYRNQILISKSLSCSKTKKIFFQKFLRHTITYDNMENLVKILLEVINPTVVNAIFCEPPILAEIQNCIISRFPSVKFIHTDRFVMDVIREDDQWDIVTTEHNRAHRSVQENFEQIISEYYFPGIKKRLKFVVSNCKICRENKYQRRPAREMMVPTPIPEYPGHILHVDILITNKCYFLTCVDKFSKFAILVPIASRNSMDIKAALFQILNRFGNVKLIVSDNEKSFKSNLIGTFLRDHYGVEQFFVPPMHSESNGQVERFHSTLLEIARCVKAQQNVDDTGDLLLLSTFKYNNSVHSVTGRKPVDIVNSVSDKILDETKMKLRLAQQGSLQRHNRNASVKIFHPGEKVFVKRNRRLGNKFDKWYVEGTIEQDLGTTVLINGRKVHKSNLR